MNYAEKLIENLNKLRQDRPLIHNITNFVVMNSTANTILSVGASPVMAHCIEEVEEMVSFAGALVLNIGTLTPDWVYSMIRAGKRANELNIPVILDPVGAGATSLRTNSSLRIMNEVKLTVIRGNPAEIKAIGGERTKIKGVDSLTATEEAKTIALELAKNLNTVVAVTGKTDLITDGNRLIKVNNGHIMLTKVTGTGCAATVVIACFLAVNKDPLLATAFGLAYFGLAAEHAGKISNGPGSFQVNLYDALANLTPEEIKQGIKIEE